jgi:hypothetical protein
MGQQLKIPFVDGMKVGRGFDLLTGTPTSDQAVEGASITPPQKGGGQTVTTTFRLVQETNALQEALGLSAAVSGGYAGFSGTAKMQFAQQCTVTQYCLYVVLAVEVINSCESIDAPKLVKDATDLLGANDPVRFRQRFGNRYISGLKTGGEYYAVYRVQSFDEEERTSVAAQISASFHNPVLSASLNSDIENSKSASQNELDVNVFVYSAGGVTTTETALAEMIDKAHLFPTLVAGNNAISYQVILDEYTGLELPTDKLDLFDIEQQTECLLFNSRLLNDFNTLINDIDFIRQHPDRFHNPDGTPPDDAALQAARHECVTIVDQLTKAISDCTKDATVCTHFTQSPEDFANRLPILRLPHPGMQKVPHLLGFKATAPNPLNPVIGTLVKNPQLIDLLAQDGFYFVIDNPDALEWSWLGGSELATAGTILSQAPPENTVVPKGTILHVTVSERMQNPVPPD